MNTENNNSANVLIAEFMEVKHLYSTTRLETLKYHSDWNWLMQVVEKIREIDQTAKGDFKNTLLHWQRNNKNIFDMSILEGKEFVYNACIEFIKWYNLNK